MTSEPLSHADEPATPAEWGSRRRWLICWALFAITVISYIDRQTISIAAPVLSSKFNLSASNIATIANAFLLAYSVGQLLAGRFMDRVGVKLGLTIVVIIWSIAAALTSLAVGIVTLSLFRALVGMAEGGSFPGAVKAAAEWFAPKERSFAVGILTSGASIGAVVTPPIVATLLVNVGWQLAFVITALPGLVWLFLWRIAYRTPARYDSPRRRSASPQDARPALFRPAGAFLRNRLILGILIARALEEPAGWFYLTWLPLYMRTYRHTSILDIGVLLVIPFITLDVGYLAGGWISSRLMRMGWSLDRARKAVMLASALLMIAGIPAVYAATTGRFIGWVSLATLGHGAWATNIIALPGDIVPQQHVGTVYGITAFAAGMASILFMQVVGTLVDHEHSFSAVFTIGGLLPILAALVLVTVPGRLVNEPHGAG